MIQSPFISNNNSLAFWGERYEAAGKWRARMTMAGFTSCPLSTYVNGAIRSLLKAYCDKYKVKEEGGALYFGWEDKILVVASAWK